MAYEKIKQILCEEFELDESEVTLEASFRVDLGFDSLDIVDMVMSIEDEFEIELPDEDLEKINIVSDLVKFIEERK